MIAQEATLGIPAGCLTSPRPAPSPPSPASSSCLSSGAAASFLTRRVRAAAGLVAIPTYGLLLGIDALVVVLVLAVAQAHPVHGMAAAGGRAATKEGSRLLVSGLGDRSVERLGVGVEELGLDLGAVFALDEGCYDLPGGLNIRPRPRPAVNLAESRSPLQSGLVVTLMGVGQQLLGHPAGGARQENVLVGVEALSGRPHHCGDGDGQNSSMVPFVGIYGILVDDSQRQVADPCHHASCGALHGHAELHPLLIGAPPVVGGDVFESPSKIYPRGRFSRAERWTRFVGGLRHSLEKL